MLFEKMRPETLLPLLCAVCHVSLAFPALSAHSEDNLRSLQVSILPPSTPISAPLGGSVIIPCLVSLSLPPPSSPIPPRVKWSVVSGGREAEVLVARGQRVKVNEAYRERAALLHYASAPDDLSLWLGELSAGDSGHYRCEVQQGLEDASDLVQVTVEGVVFHYRPASGRYAFSFPEAQRACESIGAHIATPDQLLAAYHDGYEQCDAGWLADQSVRYPIQVPREGCYGDMDGQPGVRNYGTVDPDELFDVYCYIEQIDGEVVHDPTPQQLSLDEARAFCERAGAELATTGQLYMAWSKGLDHCSPGWLADGSVRYPIVTPRERCGGAQVGVKTVYRFSNQTGFPQPSSRHDVYCFKGPGNLHTDAPMDYMATEPEDLGQDVVILMQPAEELQLSHDPEQVEREAQSVLESLPASRGTPAGDELRETPPTASSDADSPFSPTTSSRNLLHPFDETSLPSEDDYDSQLSTLPPPSHASNESNHPDTEPTLEDYDSQLSTLPPPSHVSNGSNHPDTEPTLEDYDSQQSTMPPPSHASNESNHPDTDHTPEDYDSQQSVSSPSSHASGDSDQPDPEPTPEFPEPSFEQHRHYQPMPETNIDETEYHQSRGSKHFQSMPDPNLDSMDSNYSSTVRNHTSYQIWPETTSTAFDPTVDITEEHDPTTQSRHEEKLGGELEQTSNSTGSRGETDHRPVQSTFSTYGEVTSVWSTLDGSGDVSQEIEPSFYPGVQIVSSTVTSESSTSDLTTHESAHRGATRLPGRSTTGLPLSGVSSGLDVSEELGQDVVYSTVATHFYGTSTTDLERTALPERLGSSGEVELLPQELEHEEHLGSGEEMAITESTDEATTESSDLVMTESPDLPTSGSLYLNITESPELATSESLDLDMTESPDLGSSGSPDLDMTESPDLGSSGSPDLDMTESPDLGSSGSPHLDMTESPDLGSSGSPHLDMTESPDLGSSGSPHLDMTESPDLGSSGSPHLDMTESPDLGTSWSLDLDMTESPDLATSWSLDLAMTKSPDLSTTGSLDLVMTESPDLGSSGSLDLVMTKSPELATSESLGLDMTESPDLGTSGSPDLDMTESPDLGSSGSLDLDMTESPEVATSWSLDLAMTKSPDLSTTGSLDLVMTQSPDLATTGSLDLVKTESPDLATSEALDLVMTKSPDLGTSEAQDLVMTKSPDLNTTSQMPVQHTTVGYQTKTFKTTSRISVDPTTEEEASGYEPATNPPYLEQEITVFPLKILTSSWGLHHTTSSPQESRNDREYGSSKKVPVTPTEHPDSSVSETNGFEPNSYSSVGTESPPAATAASSSTPRPTRSRRPTTPTAPPSPTESPEPERATTAPVPPADRSRAELERVVVVTRPPTLHVAPGERAAAAGGAGKPSDACLRNPCANGGTCMEEGGRATCLCLPSYGGALCGTDLQQCDVGWEKFQGSCYKHFTQRLSWEVAEQHCRMSGGHLVSIMSPEEQEFINNNFKEYQWTGLNDKTIEGDFRWSDGNPLLYENWYRGQPDSYFLSGEDCAVMVWHDAGRWSDVPCNYHLAYTCKKGTSSCGPPPKVPNASLFGKPRQRYETGAAVRFYCTQGFGQRRNPVVKCLPGGRWEEPQILCVPGARSSTQNDGVTFPPSKSQELDDEESRTTMELPQYWDIKF